MLPVSPGPGAVPMGQSLKCPRASTQGAEAPGKGAVCWASPMLSGHRLPEGVSSPALGSSLLCRDGEWGPVTPGHLHRSLPLWASVLQGQQEERPGLQSWGLRYAQSTQARSRRTVVPSGPREGRGAHGEPQPVPPGWRHGGQELRDKVGTAKLLPSRSPLSLSCPARVGSAFLLD